MPAELSRVDPPADLARSTAWQIVVTAYLAAAGEQLARMVFADPDQGHRSDMAETNDWAQSLGLER